MKCLRLAAFLVVVLPPVFWLSAQQPAPAQPANPPLAIVDVTVIDGTGRPPQPDQTVLIVQNRITNVGPSKTVAVPATARVIDARGKFLLPGFWDMHVHIAGVNADPKWSGDTLLPLLIAHGITGVRDMGGDLEALNAWKRQIAGGARLGPHILASGPWLAGRGKKSVEQFPVKDAEEARAAVRELRERGADFIKIISLPSKDAFFAVSEEANLQKLSFVGHLPASISATEASNAGMRSIEHLYYSLFSLSVSSGENELRQQLLLAAQKRDAQLSARTIDETIASFDPNKAAALWRILKQNDTWVTPTLAAIYRAGHPLPAADVRSDFLPVALNRSWADDAKDPTRETQAAQVAKQAEIDWKLAREMHAAGVPILVGSDSLDPGMIPGPSLYQEMAQLTRAGMSPMEVIVAATRDAARFAGVEKDFGTVERSKYADLVLFREDPSKDIERVSSEIHSVVLHGKYLDRAALDDLLQQARKAAAGVN